MKTDETISKNGFFSTLLTGLKQSKLLLPLGAILFISLASALGQGASFKAFRILGNFSLVLICFIYLSGLVGRDEALLRRGLSFFIFGMAFQVVAALLNKSQGWQWHEFHLLHNNHLAIFNALSFFYGLALWAVAPKKGERLFLGLLTAVIFLGLIYSGSRTAWFSFAAAYLIFHAFMRQGKRLPLTGARWRSGLALLGLTAVLLFLIVLSMKFNNDVFRRITNLPEMFNPTSWRHTLYDFQNFGLFGIFRLTQLYELGEILRHSPLWGIGFTQEVIGFHGLYFAFLGASGILGLLAFSLFCRNLTRGLLQALWDCREGGGFLFRACAFCAILVWLLASFMETLFLQFAVWVNVLTAVTLVNISALENRSGDL